MTGEESGKRGFDWGIGCAVLLLVTLLGLGSWWVASLVSSTSGSEAASPDHSRELRSLRRQLERKQDELDTVRRQARRDPQAAMSGGLREAIAEKQRELDEIVRRIEELEGK